MSEITHFLGISRLGDSLAVVFVLSSSTGIIFQLTGLSIPCVQFQSV